MNHMKDVAKLLGVELGEEFYVTYKGEKINTAVYKLTQNGLVCNDAICHIELSMLLIGANGVEKLPWKPMNGGDVWYWSMLHNEVRLTTFYGNNTYDLALYKLGKLYSTNAEAEAHAAEDNACWDEIRKELEE